MQTVMQAVGKPGQRFGHAIDGDFLPDSRLNPLHQLTGDLVVRTRKRVIIENSAPDPSRSNSLPDSGTKWGPMRYGKIVRRRTCNGAFNDGIRDYMASHHYHYSIGASNRFRPVRDNDTRHL